MNLAHFFKTMNQCDEITRAESVVRSMMHVAMETGDNATYDACYAELDRLHALWMATFNAR